MYTFYEVPIITHVYILRSRYDYACIHVMKSLSLRMYIFYEVHMITHVYISIHFQGCNECHTVCLSIETHFCLAPSPCEKSVHCMGTLRTEPRHMYTAFV